MIVLLDAFGTLLKVHKGCHPFRQILKVGVAQGRRPKPDDARVLMTEKLNLAQAADRFGIRVSPSHLKDIQCELAEELTNIQPYEDGLLAVEMLQQAGIPVAVCSNLALPYAAVVKSLYPTLDGYGFSFELGSIKPEPKIYQVTCQLVSASTEGMFSGQVMMIGDSQRCDRDGPRSVGIQGFHLSREGRGDFDNLIDFADAVIRAARIGRGRLV